MPNSTADPAMAGPASGGAASGDRAVGWLMVGGGSVGLLAALVLTVEKFLLLKDPSHRPSCSINPVLSCGSVMTKPQAEVFGFPNPLIGIVGFTVVVTLGVVVLAGVSLPRWMWRGLQVGALAGVVFVHWLIFQSLYRIGALCPYCMIVWAVTIPLFWYVVPHRLSPRLARFHGVALTVWGLAIVGLILVRFWTYWVTLV
ncbi:vitamin K epoxide reductase family protein [Kribbella deserti]|uniref:Vitamin K epoxide reductase family protein n=1 Tax=Kribbella deserti TaxID=1926257 RepID=A0ABV6QGY4_9ACTN